MPLVAITQTSDEWIVSTITVNSIHICDKYTKAQIVSYLGVPTSYADFVYSEPVESYVQECIFPDGNSFGFEAYKQTDFRLLTNRFKANGVVGVGDNISKLRQLTRSASIMSGGLRSNL